MQKEEVSYSFYVVAGFIFLFLVFVIIQPQPETTGLISLSFLQAGNSKLPIIVVGITAIIALGLAIIAYKHFRKKKHPTPNNNQNTQNPQQPPGAPKSSLTPEELKALFPEAPEQPIIAPSPAAPQPPTSQPPQPQKTLTNLNEIKELIISLMSQGQSKQQILEQLQSKGYTAQQIAKATEEINFERLAKYIKATLSQGFKKEQLTKILIESGWPRDVIDKAFQSLGQ